MKRVRRVHHYIGVLFACAILLFPLSGALQTFRLQKEEGSCRRARPYERTAGYVKRRPKAAGPFSTNCANRGLLNERRLSGSPVDHSNGRDWGAWLPMAGY